MPPIITNDAVVFGMLLLILALVFWTSSLESKAWRRFYTYFPPILICYFLPALLHWPLGLIAGEWYDPGIFDFLRNQGVTIAEGANPKEIIQNLSMQGQEIEGTGEYLRGSRLYFMASRYLLPASLILLCLSIDFKGVLNLGSKALIMFGAATVGIVLGGPIALLIITNLAPNLISVEPEQLWRGLSTIAGSWIGGGANQTAMKEIFEVGSGLFATMIVVDVVVANIWLAILLAGVNFSDRVDRWLKADNSSIVALKQKVENYQMGIAKIPTTKELLYLMGLTFAGVGLSHFLSDILVPVMKSIEPTLVAWRLNSLLSGFFWLIVFSTTIGVVLSFTKARKLEGMGASKWGTIFIYVLVTTIGMQMDIGSVLQNLGLFAVGIIWMMVHVGILLLVAKLIKAPFFFVAVGSQANVGGAASAPVVAAAFSPALAPVGALMAVLGYALGTYMAIVCAFLMQGVV
ncbi:MAG: DUF819 family protein [Saprospiraceae bacterium]